MRRLLGTDDLAGVLGVPKGTIFRWQTIGYGPPAMKIGKYLKWDPVDVEQWLADQKELARP